LEYNIIFRGLRMSYECFETTSLEDWAVFASRSDIASDMKQYSKCACNIAPYNTSDELLRCKSVNKDYEELRRLEFQQIQHQTQQCESYAQCKDVVNIISLPIDEEIINIGMLLKQFVLQGNKLHPIIFKHGLYQMDSWKCFEYHAKLSKFVEHKITFMKTTNELCSYYTNIVATLNNASCLFLLFNNTQSDETKTICIDNYGESGYNYLLSIKRGQYGNRNKTST
jgi:hypothetical protein